MGNGSRRDRSRSNERDDSRAGYRRRRSPSYTRRSSRFAFQHGFIPTRCQTQRFFAFVESEATVRIVIGIVPDRQINRNQVHDAIGRHQTKIRILIRIEMEIVKNADRVRQPESRLTQQFFSETNLHLTFKQNIELERQTNIFNVSEEDRLFILFSSLSISLDFHFNQHKPARCKHLFSLQSLLCKSHCCSNERNRNVFIRSDKLFVATNSFVRLFVLLFLDLFIDSIALLRRWSTQ